MWNVFKVNNKNPRTSSLPLFLCFCCELWTYFTPFSSASIVDFQQVNISWYSILLVFVVYHISVAWRGALWVVLKTVIKASQRIKLLRSLFYPSWHCSQVVIKNTTTYVGYLASQLTFTWSKSTIETLRKWVNKFKVNNTRQWHHSDCFIVNFEHLAHLFLVFLLLALNK